MKPKIEIHRLYIRGKYLIFDVNTLNILEVDPITYHVFDYYTGNNDKDVIAKLKRQYSIEMIANVLEEIHKLERQGIISYFPPNLSLPAIFPNSVNRLTLLLTKSCNLKCRYCYYTDERGCYMSKDIAKASVDFLLSNTIELVFLQKFFVRCVREE